MKQTPFDSTLVKVTIHTQNTPSTVKCQRSLLPERVTIISIVDVSFDHETCKDRVSSVFFIDGSAVLGRYVVLIKCCWI